MVKKKSKAPLLMMVAMLATLSGSAFSDDSKLGRISGYKFHDLNGDGYDQGEPRLPGFTITLTDKRGNYVDSEVTDSLGRFSFRNLPPGKYKVCESAPETTPPWVHTTPECVNVLLRGKAPHVKVKFGNKQATVGQIVGLKYNDVNGNATYDEGEPGLADWTINITGITDPTYSNTTQTDSEGRFSFTNLPLGRYNVCEELKSGYANTTPLCFERELTNEVLSLRAVFGNKVVTEEILGQVVGIKFNDVNGNGELDDTELGLSGWKITINGVTDPTFEDEATTGTDGRYSFTNLPLGVYEICEVPQSGWVATTPVCVTRELTALVLSVRGVFGNRAQQTGDMGCTYTQGFWKNAGEELMQSLIPPGGQILGTVHLYNFNQLQSIFDQPVQGNALVNLAHQLIAAIFNVHNGADDSVIGATITAAHNIIEDLQVPPVGSGSVVSGDPKHAQMISLAGTLDTYNNGNLEGGPEHCGDK